MDAVKNAKETNKRLLLFSAIIVLSIVILIVVLMQTAGVGTGRVPSGIENPPADETPDAPPSSDGLGDATSTEKPVTEKELSFFKNEVRKGMLLYVDDSTSKSIDISLGADLYALRYATDGTPLYHISGSARKALNQTAAEAFVSLMQAYRATPNVARIEVARCFELDVCDYDTALSIELFVLDDLLISNGLADPRFATETAWLFDNMHTYGFVYVPETETSGHLRYVGAPHAGYMYREHLTLRAYLSRVSSYSFSMPLEITDGDATYIVYYIPAGEADTFTGVVPAQPYTISGDNLGGIVVTYTK